MASTVLLVLSTAPSRKAALKISEHLLNKRLAACVSLVPSVTSLYWWKGRKEKASEVLLLIKTQKSSFKKLEKAVLQCHPYSVPEILALPIQTAGKSYLKWLLKEIDTRL